MSDPHNNELTDPTTVFRTERFTDPALAAPQPDWFAPTPPTGIPLDPIPAGVYQQRHAQAAQALAHVIAPPVATCVITSGPPPLPACPPAAPPEPANGHPVATVNGSGMGGDPTSAPGAPANAHAGTAPATAQAAAGADRAAAATVATIRDDRQRLAAIEQLFAYETPFEPGFQPGGGNAASAAAQCDNAAVRRPSSPCRANAASAFCQFSSLPTYLSLFGSRSAYAAGVSVEADVAALLCSSDDDGVGREVMRLGAAFPHGRRTKEGFVLRGKFFRFALRPPRDRAREVQVGRGARLTKVVVDRGCHIPDGMVIGEDPVEDARRFYRTDNGVTLVTQAMLDALPRA